MKSRKVKIIVFYRDMHVSFNEPTLKRPVFKRYNTTFIIDECYLLEFLPSLIREDIERVEVQECDTK